MGWLIVRVIGIYGMVSVPDAVFGHGDKKMPRFLLCKCCQPLGEGMEAN